MMRSGSLLAYAKISGVKLFTDRCNMGAGYDIAELDRRQQSHQFLLKACHQSHIFQAVFGIDWSKDKGMIMSSVKEKEAGTTLRTNAFELVSRAGFFA
eukprot:9503797-Pyramimonas_sp.AAC.2